MEKLKFPNPQFVRKNWLDLTGEWQFCFDDFDKGLEKENYKRNDFFDLTINVPYSYHVKKSNINKNENHTIVWYKKEFSIEIQDNKSYLLHFGAVDYECDVWINGRHFFYHEGGYTPFTIDISDVIQETNELVLRVVDENSCRQMIGKQSWKDHNFLCWYTRTVGIWQPVWLEITGKCYLDELLLTPHIDDATLEIEAFINEDNHNTQLKVEINFGEEQIGTYYTTFKNKRTRFFVDVSSDCPNFRLHFWSPSSPNLYDIRLTLFNEEEELDIVESYFGMRNIHTKNQLVYLNNQEFYQKLILDQGYFKDGGLTGSPEEFEADVKKIKEMGFNGVRKHQKIEDHRFMYLCDKIGLVMWAEMPSPFEYSMETNQNMVQEIYPFIKKHYNHPSVIAYTVMNESWGINEVYHDKKEQSFVDALYYLVKSMDQTRLVIGNDGWEHTTTDILTFHDYNEDACSLSKSYEDIERVVNGSPSRTSGRHAYSSGYSYNGIPIMISEYGGIAIAANEEMENGAWGYGERLNSEEEILERISSLTKAIMDTEGICGFCYTQLADVEQEINGLLTESHEYKISPEKIREILEYKYNLGFTFK